MVDIGCSGRYTRFMCATVFQPGDRVVFQPGDLVRYRDGNPQKLGLVTQAQHGLTVRWMKSSLSSAWGVRDPSDIRIVSHLYPDLHVVIDGNDSVLVLDTGVSVAVPPENCTVMVRGRGQPSVRWAIELGKIYAVGSYSECLNALATRAGQRSADKTVAPRESSAVVLRQQEPPLNSFPSLISLIEGALASRPELGPIGGMSEFGCWARWLINQHVLEGRVAKHLWLDLTGEQIDAAKRFEVVQQAKLRSEARPPDPPGPKPKLTILVEQDIED